MKKTYLDPIKYRGSLIILLGKQIINSGNYSGASNMSIFGFVENHILRGLF